MHLSTLQPVLTPFLSASCDPLQVEQLERIAVINTLVSIPVVRSLLLGVLPGLALRIFVLLLPVLLYAFNRRAGSVGQAEMDGHVSHRRFMSFLVTSNPVHCLFVRWYPCFQAVVT